LFWDPWNWFDSVVVISSVVAFFSEGAYLRILVYLVIYDSVHSEIYHTVYLFTTQFTGLLHDLPVYYTIYWGIFWGEYGVFWDPWNWFDSVVFISSVDAFFSEGNSGAGLLHDFLVYCTMFLVY